MEAIRQLRCEAVPRQVAGARVVTVGMILGQEPFE
jgi:hypothetical protein